VDIVILALMWYGKWEKRRKPVSTAVGFPGPDADFGTLNLLR
jgi:hypothetical protein